MTTKKAAKKKRMPKDKKGKRVNLYLREWDYIKIRELSKFVLENGRRASYSLMIRAALEAVATDKKFLTAYDVAAAQDGRFGPEE